MILDRIKSRVLEQEGFLRSLELKEICVGYPYTYAVVKGKRLSLGVVLTPLSELGDREVWCPPRIKRDSSVASVVELLDSTHMIERTIALAVVNAVSQQRLAAEILEREEHAGSKLGEGVTELLEKHGVKRVAVIGNMSPIVKELLARGCSVIVFERSREYRVGNVLPDCLEPRMLPEAEALVITGASLVNDTLDLVLLFAQNSRLNILVGPTAQVHPSLLAGEKIHYVSSCFVRDLEKALWLLRISAWRKALFGPHVTWYTLRVGVEA